MQLGFVLERRCCIALCYLRAFAKAQAHATLPGLRQQARLLPISAEAKAVLSSAPPLGEKLTGPGGWRAAMRLFVFGSGLVSVGSLERQLWTASHAVAAGLLSDWPNQAV